MAELVTLVEQHMEKEPPTVVILATTWWEAEPEHVTLQEVGLGVNLPVRVCCYTNLSSNYQPYLCILAIFCMAPLNSCELWHSD